MAVQILQNPTFLIIYVQSLVFSNFIEIELRHWCFPVNLLHIFKTLFPMKHLWRDTSVFITFSLSYFYLFNLLICIQSLFIFRLNYLYSVFITYIHSYACVSEILLKKMIFKWLLSFKTDFFWRYCNHFITNISKFCKM